MEAFDIRTTAFRAAPHGRSKAAARTRSAPKDRPTPSEPAMTTATTPSAGSNPKVDYVFPSEPETYQVEVEEVAGELRLRVLWAQGEEWVPVSGAMMRQGITSLLRRESRLERTAERYGMAAEALLASLEQSVVDVADSASGIPDAEREALRAAGISLDGSEEDPSGAGQVAKGLARFAQFRSDALSVSEAASRMGKTDGRVRQLVAARHLTTITNGEAGYLLPDWQFVGDQTVPGLAMIVPALDAVHPLTLAGFMTHPDPDLEIDGSAVTPVQWLLSGGSPEPVAELAAGLGISA